MTKEQKGNPLLFPLRGELTSRGVKVSLDCQLDRDVIDTIRPGRPRMKELRISVPLLATHPIYADRRMVLGIGQSLEAWRTRLSYRGINLLSVTLEGITVNTEGIVDSVCSYIYRISAQDLREMIEKGMPMAAITAFTGICGPEVRRIVAKFYGMNVREIRVMGEN